MQNTNYQTEPSISNLPSREGQEVCHVRAQPPQTKTTTEAQQTPPQKHLITNKNPASQNSPLERGRGCVTSEHSHLKPKQTPETNKPHLKKTPHPKPRPSP